MAGVVGSEAIGTGAVSGAWAAGGSCSSSRAIEPDGRRRRRLLDGPAARSGLALAAGGAAIAGGSGTVPFARGRRLRRLGAVPVATAAAGSAARRRPPGAPRFHLAP